MDHQLILSLLDKALRQRLSDAEMSELLELAGDDRYEPAFIAAMEKQFTTFAPDSEEDIPYWMTRKTEIYEQLIVKRRGDRAPVHRDIRPSVPFRLRWWAAASVILVLGISVYLWSTQKKNTIPVLATVDTPDIAPGKDGAILTLADGSQVLLDSLGNGVVALQSGSKAVIKNGELVYDLTGEKAREAVYNTMTTPKGRQFILLLPDGTKVWLNAASSVRYPTVFSGRERKVEVTGEAYFEVAKNAQAPFLVNVNNKATVEVLGTRFNVNAYEDEASINTTLLEGSVKVNGTIINPGQQAQIIPVAGRSANGSPAQAEIKLIEDINIDKVMAWKNGAFDFNGASLAEVMRQLERWYDIEVVYEKGIPDIHFVGEMSRGVSLEGLITGLEASEVHFRIEKGRRLVVMP